MRVTTLQLETLLHRINLPEGDKKHISREMLQMLLEAPKPAVPLEPIPALPTYLVTVDYTQSLDEMKAAGEYDYTNSSITSVNFPMNRESGAEETEIILVHYGKNMSTDAVLADFDTQGLRPATIAELLALGAKEKKLQLQFPLVVLGSVLQSGRNRSYPCFSRDGAGRALDLYWAGNDWLGVCRFPAVRK